MRLAGHWNRGPSCLKCGDQKKLSTFNQADLDSIQSLSESVRDGKLAGLPEEGMNWNDMVALDSRIVELRSLRTSLSWEFFPTCFSQHCMKAMLSV